MYVLTVAEGGCTDDHEIFGSFLSLSKRPVNLLSFTQNYLTVLVMRFETDILRIGNTVNIEEA